MTNLTNAITPDDALLTLRTRGCCAHVGGLSYRPENTGDDGK